MSMSFDTSTEMAKRQYAALGEMMPAERGALMAALCEDVTELALAGIRRQHPDATPSQVRRHLLVRRYGEGFVEQLPSQYQ